MDQRFRTKVTPVLTAQHLPLRALVVEDDAVTREILVQLLRTGGYEVLAADSGERAFRMMRAWRGRLDLLFTETQLPGLIDGWMLGDEFRQSHPGRPIIYAAGNETSLTEPQMGAAIVRKPVPLLDVLALAKRMTSAAEAASAAAEVTTAAAA